MLLQNPQLAYALLQAQVVMRIVNPEIAMVSIDEAADARLDERFKQTLFWGETETCLFDLGFGPSISEVHSLYFVLNPNTSLLVFKNKMVKVYGFASAED